ncbi:MAG: nucleoside recognition domain-containing protein [Gammaproteobacteria bacterium]|nr:nucleoside recognition domain-containing protein [Gammaproteobacteria bacterium]
MVSEFIRIILEAGRAGVELGLFVVLPIMIVMLTLMRILEGWGLLDWIVDRIAPLLRPFGLTGMGVFAMLQISFVSFAGPAAALAIMDQQGASRKHIAATLAMVLSMAQANVIFPMAAKGLDLPVTLIFSLISGLVGAASTWYLFSRKLPDRLEPPESLPEHPQAADTKGLIDIINHAGREAFSIVAGAIPLLVLALVLVKLLDSSGVIELLGELLAPVFQLLGVSPNLLLPVVTKYIAGGTAMMGVVSEFLRDGLISVTEFNRMAGFLIHPFDLAGVALLISSGPRVASVFGVAVYGTLVAIAVRTCLHLLWF